MNGLSYYSGKIYFGLLHEVRLWVTITKIGTDAMMHDVQMADLLTLKCKAMGCKVLQSAIVVEVTRVAGCGCLYCK